MTDDSKDLGIATVLLERIRTQRLPRVLEMKEKVKEGEMERALERQPVFLQCV